LSKDKKTEFLVDTEHFTQSDTEDLDLAIQINDFLDQYSIRPEDIIDIKYSSHYDNSSEINCYSALLIRRIEVDVDEDSEKTE